MISTWRWKVHIAVLDPATGRTKAHHAIGVIRYAPQDVVLVSGAEANEQFFRAPDATLDEMVEVTFTVTPRMSSAPAPVRLRADASPGCAKRRPSPAN